MIKKLIKISISILLSISLSILPNTVAYSKTVNLVSSQTILGTSALDLSGTASVDYEAPMKLAQKKASLLTSVYGETSVQYALINHGEIVLSGQSGVYSKNSVTALTQNNMYGIGSISKIFTTVAVMQLVEQGRVDLDKPVINYIPEFTMADSRYKDITVRMLLNHSSGLMGSTFSNAMLFNDNDTSGYQNFLSNLQNSRIKDDPGAFSVYCNDGFTLAELLVEKVSGVSFTKYIKDYISIPLGLNHTKTPQDKFSKSDMVKTYIQGSDYDLPVDNLNMIGAGGIYSSAADLCQFANIFMRDSFSKVLTAASASAMENAEYKNGLWPADEDSMLSYGLGWDSVDTYPFTQYDIKALAKGGDTMLYHSSMIVLPEEGMAMAVCSSGGASTYDHLLAQEVLLSALKAKGSIDKIIPNKTFSKPVKAEMPDSEKGYEGFYAFNQGIIKATINDDGILKLSNASVSQSSSQRFIYTGDGKFYSSDGSSYISFVNESNGNTYLNVVSYVVIPSLGQIIDSGYEAQKILTNPLPEVVKKAWEDRNYKKYFLVSEKYSSQLYIQGSPFTQLGLVKGLEGYCYTAKILDKNNASTLIQIPGNFGRDLIDLTFYKEGSVEYLRSGANILISEDAVKELSAKSSFSCKVNSKGEAHWYKINKNLKNKKLKVTVPAKASFSLYDSKGNYMNDSWVSNESTVKLPDGGYIVFAGNAGAVFKVNYRK